MALACVYLAVTPGHFQSIDGMLMFQQARSLLYDGSLSFSQPFLWGGRVYETSFYGIGQSLAYLPSLSLFSGFEPLVFEPGQRTMDFRRVYQDVVYALAAAPVQAAFTAIAAHRIASLVRALGFERRIALWALVLFGLGSPALVYAGSDFSQPLTALCVVVAIERAVSFRHSAATRDLLLSGSALGYAVLTRPLDGGVLLPFVFLLCLGVPGRRIEWPELRRVGLVLGSLFALGCGITLLVNQIRFGALFHNEYAAQGAGFVAPSAGVTGILGLLVSPARGLLWAFPAIWLAPLGVASLWRRPEWRPAALAVVGFPMALLLATGNWFSWWGGTCWGPRLMLSALPLLAVLAVAGLAELPRRWQGVAGWTLLLAGLLYAVPGVTTDLLEGYAVRVANSAGNFSIQNYPPFGAWQFVSHAFASSPLDRFALDIVWFRTAHRTGFLSLVPFAALLGVAAWLGWRVKVSSSAEARDTGA